MSTTNLYDKSSFANKSIGTEFVKNFSVHSELEKLQSNLYIDAIYKTCSTYEEFCNRLFTLTSDKRIYGKYSIVYLAFHGQKNKIQIGRCLSITKNYVKIWILSIISFLTCFRGLFFVNLSILTSYGV